MVLPSSGAISFSQINTELGFSSSAQLSIGGTAARNLAGVASGAISMSNFYGKSSFAFTTDTATLGSTVSAGNSFSYNVGYTLVSGSGTITPVLTSYPSGFSASSGTYSNTLTLGGATTTGTITYTITVPAGTSAGTYTWVWQVGSITMTWNINVTTALQTKTLTMGFYQENSGTVWEPFTTSYYGYNKVYNAGGLSPNDSDSLWTPSGRWTTIEYYEDDLGNTNVIIQIASAVGYAASPNSGFTSVTINGVTYNRASATYSSSGTGTFNFFGDGQRRYATWQWPSVGGVNPFAGLPAGATVQVTWN